MGFHNFITYDTFYARSAAAHRGPSLRTSNESAAAPPMFDHESKAPRATASPEPFTGTVIRFHNGVVVTLKEIVYRQYALIGRGTYLMVKISWPSRWRTSEVDFLEAAHTYALNQNDEHILGHIPQVLLHQNFYSTVDGPRGKCAFENDDHRVLRVIVMASYFPMTQLHTASDFTQVIVLFTTDKQVVGVLIDFDLAVFVEVNPRTGSLHLDRRFRTGTLPFMAIDLLYGKDKIHWVRHDLESILWVTVWYTARYHEGTETTRAFQDLDEIRI
ncbi:hypothetical protein BS47DRAFT_1403189 [Hydnum rufescens UP504]|uniref:Fungal-type protein kinase domain-containing protein n=1 Tax=Hydnum rufescens UP504 TaxID=1448309 RepID=A0A9P6AB91_9AGAM|nr:hypothetical protein BS47DRAFT_1403189 [Hydnum rufescens UP504]